MRRVGTAVVVAFVLAVSACGDSARDETTTTTTPGSEVTTSEPTTTAAPTTTTTTTTVPETTTTTIAPTPVDGPIPGSMWIVVGVTHDDVLNVRAAPGTSASVVGILAPTSVGIEASGEAMQVGTVIWWEVDTGSVEGWASSRYLAGEGATDDSASSVVEANGGVPPEADTMEELADAVIAILEADEVVVVTPATVGGEIGEITVDAFVRGDDAVRGQRLHIFGQRIGDDSPFGLYAVEATSLCWRAVDAAGLCV